MIEAFIFFIGLTIGSFINALVYRMHKGKSAFVGRSFCPNCKHTLTFLDLIPVYN